MLVYMPHMTSPQLTMWPGALIYIITHYWHILLTKYVCYIAHIQLHYYISLHIDPTLLHISGKKTTNYNIYLQCYCHICASNKHTPKCHKNQYTQITWCASMEEVCKYMLCPYVLYYGWLFAIFHWDPVVIRFQRSTSLIMLQWIQAQAI